MCAIAATNYSCASRTRPSRLRQVCVVIALTTAATLGFAGAAPAAEGVGGRPGGFRPPTGGPPRVILPPRGLLPGIREGIEGARRTPVGRVTRRQIPTLSIDHRAIALSDAQLVAGWHRELELARLRLGTDEAANRFMTGIKYGAGLVIAFGTGGAGPALATVYWVIQGSTEIYRSSDKNKNVGVGNIQAPWKRATREGSYQVAGEAVGHAGRILWGPVAGFVIKGGVKVGGRTFTEGRIRTVFGESARVEVRRGSDPSPGVGSSWK